MFIEPSCVYVLSRLGGLMCTGCSFFHWLLSGLVDVTSLMRKMLACMFIDLCMDL